MAFRLFLNATWFRGPRGSPLGIQPWGDTTLSQGAIRSEKTTDRCQDWEILGLPDLKILLLDIVVICSVARALGWVFEKLHQPRVVGEMCAGILLGSSLLGWLAPPAFVLLFPPEGLASLYVLS